MPKFIGRTITGSRNTEHAPEGSTLVCLTYSQAVKLPASEVYTTLNTSDRGSRGSFAKRWYNWYATVEAIESCDRATHKMREAARARRTAPLTILIKNLEAVAAYCYKHSAEAIDNFVSSLVSAAYAAIGVHVLTSRPELLHEVVFGGGDDHAVASHAVASVAEDALINVGVSPNGAAAVIWHIRKINSNSSRGRQTRAVLAGVAPDLVARAREIWGA